MSSSKARPGAAGLRQPASGVAGHGGGGGGGGAAATYDRLRFESVGGWHVGHLPGLSTVWRLSTVKALHASRMSVATTRPEPLASSVTGASSVIAASS